jgi:hypothetical protein
MILMSTIGGQLPGDLLARDWPELVIAGRAFIDVWVEHVMPHALTRHSQ